MEAMNSPEITVRAPSKGAPGIRVRFKAGDSNTPESADVSVRSTVSVSPVTVQYTEIAKVSITPGDKFRSIS